MSTTSPAPAWLETAAKAGDDAPADRVPIAPTAPAKPKPRAGVADGEVAVIAELRGPKPADGAVLVRTGYHGRTLLPSTMVLVALTVVGPIAAAAYVPAAWRMTAFGLPLAALWLVQLIRCGYRVLFYDYRLTERHLELRRGWLYAADGPLDLATVGGVIATRWPFGWLTGTGCIRISPEGDGKPQVFLTGVRRPRALANQIEEAARKARGRNVVTAKVNTLPVERE
jgi:Bacterial PH domain